MEVIPKLIGAPVQRREDPVLVRGEGTYTGDVRPAGTAVLAIVRSPVPHGRVVSIDTSEAERAPGVLLVLRPEDVADVVMPPTPRPDKKVPRRYPLVQGTVLMPGDPVVAIVAETAAQARDAADLVWVDYEELPVVGDADEAIEAPPIYPEFGTNVAFERAKGERSDIEAIDAALTLEGTVEHQRVVPNPMETRAVVASWRDGKLTVWLSSQAPHLMAEELARSFGLPLADVRVITPFVGGGFGCKFDLAEEEYLAVVAARRLGRPVKWVEGRREHLATIGHGRSQRHRFLVKADADGRILGLWVDAVVDIGCRQRYLPPFPVTPRMGTGNYAIDRYAWRQRGVYTNRAPRGIYRGAGRPEATFTIERIMDRVAAELGIDPVEIRRRNFVASDAFPYRSAGGYTYDSGDYEKALDRLVAFADYDGLRRRQEERRAAGEVVGIGVAAYVEVCAFEAWEAGRVVVQPDGSVVVSAGTLDQGQGHRTAFAQLAADALGIPIGSVRVEQGDSALAPYGFGTSGSRSAAMGGSAVHGAAERVADKARRIAAHLLEAAAEDIVLADGKATVRGTDRAVSWQEIAKAAYRGRDLPEDEEPGLESEHHWRSGGLNFPFGMDLALVSIDPETGNVTLEALWAVDDVGNVINPLLVDGQRHGGLAQGIGQALWEEARYDADGNLVTGSLMDYLLPAAEQLPRFDLDRTVTPSPTNPLGVKGVGEAGTIGSIAAVVNAVVDALSPFGVTDITPPLRPERIWRAMHGGA